MSDEETPKHFITLEFENSLLSLPIYNCNADDFDGHLYTAFEIEGVPERITIITNFKEGLTKKHTYVLGETEDLPDAEEGVGDYEYIKANL